MTDLSVIVISYNTKALTLACLKSVLSHTKDIDYELIVVDNASSDGSSEAIAKLFGTTKVKTSLLTNKTNTGFGGGNNQALAKAEGRYILLLNSDTLVHDNVLGELVTWMDSHAKVGIVSCKLLNKDGSTQECGGYFPTLPRVFDWMIGRFIPGFSLLVKQYHPMRVMLGKDGGFFAKRHQQDWVKGAFFMLRKVVYDQIGGFDPDYFMYVEEVDVCYRAKQKGWVVFYEPKWAITHLGGGSIQPGDQLIREFAGVKTFYGKHMPAWQLPVARWIMKMGINLRRKLYARKGNAEMVKIYTNALKTI